MVKVQKGNEEREIKCIKPTLNATVKIHPGVPSLSSCHGSYECCIPKKGDAKCREGWGGDQEKNKHIWEEDISHVGPVRESGRGEVTHRPTLPSCGTARKLHPKHTGETSVHAQAQPKVGGGYAHSLSLAYQNRNCKCTHTDSSPTHMLSWSEQAKVRRCTEVDKKIVRQSSTTLHRRHSLPWAVFTGAGGGCFKWVGGIETIWKSIAWVGLQSSLSKADENSIASCCRAAERGAQSQTGSFILSCKEASFMSYRRMRRVWN